MSATNLPRGALKKKAKLKRLLAEAMLDMPSAAWSTLVLV
jgi:hypothetical protein